MEVSSKLASSKSTKWIDEGLRRRFCCPSYFVSITMNLDLGTHLVRPNTLFGHYPGVGRRMYPKYRSRPSRGRFFIYFVCSNYETRGTYWNPRACCSIQMINQTNRESKRRTTKGTTTRDEFPQYILNEQCGKLHTSLERSIGLVIEAESRGKNSTAKLDKTLAWPTRAE